MAQQNESGREWSGDRMAMAGAAAGIIALAGAGVYLLYGKNGERNRRKLRDGIAFLEKEAARRYEQLKDINEEVLLAVIAGLRRRYAFFRNMDVAEMAALAKGIKRQWRNLKGENAESGRSRTRRRIKASSPE